MPNFTSILLSSWSISYTNSFPCVEIHSAPEPFEANAYNNARLRCVYSTGRPVECVPSCCCSAPPALAPGRTVYQRSSSPLMTQQPLCTLTSLPLLGFPSSLPARTHTKFPFFPAKLVPFPNISIILLPFRISLRLPIPDTDTSLNSFYTFYPFPVPGV